MSKKKDSHYERAFLNSPGFHSIASIMTSIEDWSDDKETNIDLYGYYYISNCDRKIELVIDLNTEEELNNSIYKMNKIIEVTDNFKNVLESLRPKIKEYETKEKIKP